MNKVHPHIFAIFLLFLSACSGNRQYESTRQEQQDTVEYYSSFSGIDSVLSCLYDSLVYHSANGLYLDRFMRHCKNI